METKTDFKDRLSRDCDDSFNRFLERAETKLMMSMVPPLPTPELLTTLLRSAFDAGSGAGQGAMIGELLTGILKDRKDGDKRPPFGA